MDTLRESMIRQAQSMYKTIYPCGVKRSLSDCFTSHNNKIVFWFNTEDQSTHMLTSELAAVQEA